MQEEELLFLQLPDWLLSQLPLQDIKTKVPNKYGQTVVIKQDEKQEARLPENACTLDDLTASVISRSPTHQGRGSTSWAKSLWM